MRGDKLKEIRRIQDDIEQGKRNVSSVERQRNPAKAFIEKDGKFHQSRRKLSHCKRAIRECSRMFAVEQPPDTPVPKDARAGIGRCQK